MSCCFFLYGHRYPFGCKTAYTHAAARQPAAPQLFGLFVVLFFLGFAFLLRPSLKAHVNACEMGCAMRFARSAPHDLDRFGSFWVFVARLDPFFLCDNNRSCWRCSRLSPVWLIELCSWFVFLCKTYKLCACHNSIAPKLTRLLATQAEDLRAESGCVPWPP